MSDVFDYLKWRGDLSFTVSPFCEVDALILSEIAYIDFSGIVPPRRGQGITLKNAARRFFERHRGKVIRLGEILPDSIVLLLREAASSKRFSQIHLFGYVSVYDEKRGEQFSAISYLLDDGTLCVTFRGTDDTILGWKEDFCMSFKTPIPAQERAVRYLRAMTGREEDKNVIVCGHSKGGNLAVWSAIHADAALRAQMSAVYNLDGPGFLKDISGTGGYRALAGKLHTIVPECSVVGMFFSNGEEHRIIKSSARGLYQHDGMTWQVLGSEFVGASEISPEFRKINRTISRWIANMDDGARESFVEAVFSVFASANATTLTELAADRPALLKAITKLDSETRSAIILGLRILLESGKRG